MPPDFAACEACVLFNAALLNGWLHELRVLVSGDDEGHAYRSVPTSQPGMTIAYLIDPSSGEVMAVARSGHSFGLAASLPNYARRPCVLVAVARRAFAAPTHYFVDDVTAVDLECALGRPVHTVTGPDSPPLESFPFSAQGSVRHLARILNVNLPLAKSTLPAAVSVNCGLTTDCSSLAQTGTVRLRAKQSTRVKIVDRANEGSTRAAEHYAGACGLAREQVSMGFLTLVGR
jgi:hypothetical protein